MFCNCMRTLYVSARMADTYSLCLMPEEEETRRDTRLMRHIAAHMNTKCPYTSYNSWSSCLCQGNGVCISCEDSHGILSAATMSDVDIFFIVHRPLPQGISNCPPALFLMLAIDKLSLVPCQHCLLCSREGICSCKCNPWSWHLSAKHPCYQLNISHQLPKNKEGGILHRRKD